MDAINMRNSKIINGILKDERNELGKYLAEIERLNEKKLSICSNNGYVRGKERKVSNVICDIRVWTNIVCGFAAGILGVYYLTFNIWNNEEPQQETEERIEQNEYAASERVMHEASEEVHAARYHSYEMIDYELSGAASLADEVAHNSAEMVGDMLFYAYIERLFEIYNNNNYVNIDANSDTDANQETSDAINTPLEERIQYQEIEIIDEK